MLIEADKTENNPVGDLVVDAGDRVDERTVRTGNIVVAVNPAVFAVGPEVPFALRRRLGDVGGGCHGKGAFTVRRDHAIHPRTILRFRPNGGTHHGELFVGSWWAEQFYL